MYLKELIISSHSKIIRKIEFHLGTNLIVDGTVGKSSIETGNNIGKTTVLALIDYCLGGDAEQIYKDPETKKEIDFVKDYLIQKEVLITLILKEDLEQEDSIEVELCRNFLQRNKKIMSINGENLIRNKGKDYEKKLGQLLMDRQVLKPSFRQLIAHNIRYKDNKINNTLKILNHFSTNLEYETLFLFMFGLPVSDKSSINKKLKLESEYKKRLEREHSRTELELQLDIIKNNINSLEYKKSTLNLNEKYEEELAELNNLKYQISNISSKISELSLREQLLLETEAELKKDMSQIDFSELRRIYSIVKKNISDIQKSFEEMVEYHNNMIIEKIKYITQDIPKIRSNIEEYKSFLAALREKEKELSNKIIASDTFQDLELIITNLTEYYHRAGELENKIEQIDNLEASIRGLNEEIELVDGDRFSEEFQERLKIKLKQFNIIFAEVSNELYGEQYGITYSIKEDRNTKHPYYFFECFNANTSSGKKQGEIICFDIAYTLFARKNSIPALDFILNDKKELMHSNQLKTVNQYAKEHKIQLVFSILKDKLPKELANKQYIVLTLSDKDKLFRIEQTI